MGLAGLKSSCQQGWVLLKTLGDVFSCLSSFLHPSLVAPHCSNLCTRHRISFGSGLHASFSHFEGPLWSHPLWSHWAHSDNLGKPPCLKVRELSHLLPWKTTYSLAWGWLSGHLSGGGDILLFTTGIFRRTFTSVSWDESPRLYLNVGFKARMWPSPYHCYCHCLEKLQQILVLLSFTVPGKILVVHLTWR